MTICERASGRVIVLDIEGRLTIQTLRDRPLVAHVRRLLREGRTAIVLNLEKVLYVDTTGLANLVESYIATERQGGALKLVHLTPPVRQLLTTTRLLTVVEAYESEEDAVTSF